MSWTFPRPAFSEEKYYEGGIPEEGNADYGYPDEGHPEGEYANKGHGYASQKVGTMDIYLTVFHMN